MQNDRKKTSRNKYLRGKFFVAEDEFQGKKSWQWVKKNGLKGETKEMIIGTQGLVLRTRSVGKVIDKENIDEKRRMCGEREDTLAHIVSESLKLAQKTYKNWRDEQIASARTEVPRRRRTNLAMPRIDNLEL